MWFNDVSAVMVTGATVRAHPAPIASVALGSGAARTPWPHIMPQEDKLMMFSCGDTPTYARADA